MATSTSLENQWKDFKVKFGKTYDESEDGKRFEIFKGNLQDIEKHNKKYDTGEVTYKKGINQFADLTPEEMKKFKGHISKPQ